MSGPSVLHPLAAHEGAGGLALSPAGGQSILGGLLGTAWKPRRPGGNRLGMAEPKGADWSSSSPSTGMCPGTSTVSYGDTTASQGLSGLAGRWHVTAHPNLGKVSLGGNSHGSAEEAKARTAAPRDGPGTAGPSAAAAEKLHHPQTPVKKADAWWDFYLLCQLLGGLVSWHQMRHYRPQRNVYGVIPTGSLLNSKHRVPWPWQPGWLSWSVPEGLWTWGPAALSISLGTTSSSQKWARASSHPKRPQLIRLQQCNHRLTWTQVVPKYGAGSSRRLLPLMSPSCERATRTRLARTCHEDVCNAKQQLTGTCSRAEGQRQTGCPGKGTEEPYLPVPRVPVSSELTRGSGEPTC